MIGKEYENEMSKSHPAFWLIDNKIYEAQYAFLQESGNTKLIECFPGSLWSEKSIREGNSLYKGKYFDTTVDAIKLVSEISGSMKWESWKKWLKLGQNSWNLSLIERLFRWRYCPGSFLD